jgi:hypothetical protein
VNTDAFNIFDIVRNIHSYTSDDDDYDDDGDHVDGVILGL